jgi:CBS domain-containing protein
MKTRAVMTKTVKYVGPNSDLASAGRVMAENDCGALPIIDEKGRVIGIVTDRDICLALTAKNRLASEIPVTDVMSTKVYSCGPDDDIQTALRTMQNKQVRRLPVLNEDGKLQGILSMDDIVLRASSVRAATPPEVTYGEALNTLQEIYKSRPSRARIITQF